MVPEKSPAITGDTLSPTSAGKLTVTRSSRPEIDLADPTWYLNREWTWLSFKRRVLLEAADERVPLLERVKYLAMVSDNIDDFFMKRIGGLKQQIGAGVQELTPDGRTPRQQVQECYGAIRALEREKNEILLKVLQLLRQQGICLVSLAELSASQRKQLRSHYQAKVASLLTPQSLDAALPFPFIANLSLNLLVALRAPKSGVRSLARVRVPVQPGSPRFIRVAGADWFVTLEDLLIYHLESLFPGQQAESCGLFRVTRNANTDPHVEEADDLLLLVESELKERKFAPFVRLEVAAGMSRPQRAKLASGLQLHEESDVFEVPSLFALRDLFEIARLDYPLLHDPLHRPVDHHLLQKPGSIFRSIREAGSLLLQHPYESFASSVERLLREAAADSKVRGIKMTLYRCAGDSCIIESLLQAAQNGKQVAVVIELKARFDEAANIRLAGRLEEAGVHVTFGVVGLTTYCKVILIVRQEDSGLRRYVHTGTGNYHADKAREFSDLGLLTCDEAIGRDATELFNYLTTGFSARRDYLKLLTAPKALKKAILSMIAREAELHAAHGGGLIRFKINALEDSDIIRALYRASQAGVCIELIVRDSCRLRPGLAGLSENIRVMSLLGRFMEHSRIYYFRNNGQDDFFIGSADLMKRNLEARVDIMVPVEAPELKRELQAILDIQQSDQRSASDMQPDGSYLKRAPGNDRKNPGSHQSLIACAQQRSKAVQKEKKIRM
jgi:polyphosphate kinase